MCACALGSFCGTAWRSLRARPPQQVFATSGLINLPITKVSPARLLDQTEKPLSQPGLESFSPTHSLALHQHGCSLGNNESALLFR